MQTLDDRSVLRLADPARLQLVFFMACAEIARRRAEEDKRWRLAVDGELTRDGVFARVVAANAAIRSAEFAVAMNAAGDERSAARDENDIARLGQRILKEMEVDMTDVMIRLRRAEDAELTRAERRRGVAQLRLRACPTPAVAQVAIDRARAAGYPPPGDAALATAEAGTQAGQGTIGR